MEYQMVALVLKAQVISYQKAGLFSSGADLIIKGRGGRVRNFLILFSASEDKREAENLIVI